MTQIFYIQSTDDETGVSNLVLFIPGEEPATASSESHANFDEIVDAVQEAVADPYGVDGQALLDLFDISVAVQKRLEPLSERISVANGRVYLDGDEVENALTRQIVRFLEEGVDDWEPLVEFFENVQANPNAHSRSQLFEWLDRRDFTIDDSGCIIGYKGVTSNLKSIHSGPGIVNGVRQTGQLDNSPGNTVEMARSQVTSDPTLGCHIGLHVGTYEYAASFGHKVLKVQVNPRDVVSVPTDCDAQKMRCCRYVVLEETASKVDSAYWQPTAVADDDWYEDDDDYEWDDLSDLL